MTDLSTFLTLADIPLNPAVPKPTSLEGNQMEASRALYSSPDGRVEIGIWECTPGRFTADRSGLVTLSCRSKCSFKPPCVRKRRGFSNPMLSDGGVDCRNR
jgi:hypothetical protein